MLNFDPDRFTRIQTGALALADDLGDALRRCLDDGAANLVLTGAGGVQILMQPAFQLLRTRSTFPVHYEMGAELVRTDSVHLTDRSIVLLPSLSGTTAEAIEVVRFAKSKGATVVTLTGHADTPIADLADRNFTNFAEDDTSAEMFYLLSLVAALAILDHRDELEDHAGTIGELKRLPERLLAVKAQFEDRARELASTYRNEPYLIVTGAGSVWPEAHYYGMCILEEMQWIRTRPVHASDFFHGTLELVEKDVSVLVLQGEDACRPLTERVVRFLPRVTDRMEVIDTAAFELPELSTATRALISPVLLATALERLSAHLEQVRDHPLTTRRYYKKLDY
ncbi:MAG TPA: SIS domain-containing protein [Longimicrobiales bacterium]|nr:SIS domain-containing protein [Longimicrobiales bacterium]